MLICTFGSILAITMPGTNETKRNDMYKLNIGSYSQRVDAFIRPVDFQIRPDLLAGVPGSTMILSSIETAALVACCRRADDCATAARRASR
jgi:hypothetical protein